MKTIDGFEDYSISRDGVIFSKKLNRNITPNTTQKGYISVNLNNNGFRKYFFLHRLVAMTYIPNPQNKPQVNHINGIKNDNRVENLEWVTLSENIQHAVKTGLRDKAHLKAKIDNSKPVIDTNTGIKYPSLKDACFCLNLNYDRIRVYINRKAKKQLNLQYL